MSKLSQKVGKISAFIIAYREESLIERCLQSLVGVVDEIIVVHDGPCSDNTIKIAQKYTKKVFETKTQRGIGESHYIFALKKTNFNWVLRIDADEYLSKKLQKELSALTRSKEVAAYNFIWPIWDGSKYISKGWPYKIFLFQKNKIGLVDIFHYPIIVYGKTKNAPFIVHHKPKYNNYTVENFERKIKKWCRYQAQDYLKPLKEKERYNTDLEHIKRSINIKLKLYNFPFLCFVIAYMNVIHQGLRNPRLFLQKGFWLTALIAARYSNNVSKEYILLKRTSKKFWGN